MLIKAVEKWRSTSNHFISLLQDTTLFNATLEENIAYGREGATREDVVAAAQAAHLHDAILSWPKVRWLLCRPECLCSPRRLSLLRLMTGLRHAGWRARPQALGGREATRRPGPHLPP